MNAERWTRLKEIFGDALAQPAESRRAWVKEACGDDADLLRNAEALLQAHDTAGDFLERPVDVDRRDLDSLPEGTTLGPYRIVREIGRGGMGILYLAHDNMERQVALKTLPPVLSDNTQLRERLRREAQAVARIKHSGVATVHALAEIEGRVVVVSEYVEGETLRAFLGRGPIAPARAYQIAMEIAHAIAAAHDAGVVHRDLKPENVIVTATGQVKVVDFGIAHIETPESKRLTVPGFAIGTPAYMAPEQLSGGAVTPRADIYSFGIVLREMIAAPQFAGIIDRCVSIDPAERYASARELVQALAVAGPPDSRGPGPAPPRDTATVAGSPRWWWEFHQAAAAAVYSLMTWPAWVGREIVDGQIGRSLFFATLTGVVVATTLRLHLWFTSRFYPAELRWARRRGASWIRAADWLFVASLALTGILVGEDRSPVAIVLLAVSVGATIAFVIIEPATARAAFRNSAASRESIRNT